MNTEAAKYAKELAKKSPVSSGGFRLLSGGIGENTYSHCGSTVSGASVTNVW